MTRPAEHSATIPTVMFATTEPECCVTTGAGLGSVVRDPQCRLGLLLVHGFPGRGCFRSCRLKQGAAGMNYFNLPWPNGLSQEGHINDFAPSGPPNIWRSREQVITSSVIRLFCLHPLLKELCNYFLYMLYLVRTIVHVVIVQDAITYVNKYEFGILTYLWYSIIFIPRVLFENR